MDEGPRLRRPCLPWPRRPRPRRLDEAEAVSAAAEEQEATAAKETKAASAAAYQAEALAAKVAVSTVG